MNMIKLKKLISFIALFLMALVILPLGGLTASAQAPQGLEMGGETTETEGAYTVKNGYVKSQETYNGYILTLKFKASADSAFCFEFGEYAVSFSEGGAVAEGFTLIDNAFSYAELQKDCVLRIEAFGTEFSMGVYTEGALEGIYENVLEGTLPASLSSCQVSFAVTQGELYIRDFNGYTLNSTVEIETEDYDKEKEDAYNQLVVKPEKGEDGETADEKGCNGCSGSVFGAATGVTLASLLTVAFRKRNRKEK